MKSFILVLFVFTSFAITAHASQERTEYQNIVKAFAHSKAPTIAQVEGLRMGYCWSGVIKMKKYQSMLDARVEASELRFLVYKNSSVVDVTIDQFKEYAKVHFDTDKLSVQMADIDSDSMVEKLSKPLKGTYYLRRGNSGNLYLKLSGGSNYCKFSAGTL